MSRNSNKMTSIYQTLVIFNHLHIHFHLKIYRRQMLPDLYINKSITVSMLQICRINICFKIVSYDRIGLAKAVSSFVRIVFIGCYERNGLFTTQLWNNVSKT